MAYRRMSARSGFVRRAGLLCALATLEKAVPQDHGRQAGGQLRVSRTHVD